MTTRTPTRPLPVTRGVGTGARSARRRTPAPTAASPRVEPMRDEPMRAEPIRHRRRPRIDLSLTQVLASASAAVTATVAGSYLGVTGTVLGAAVASVVTVIGNAVYSTSLRHTRERVRAVVPAPRRGRRPVPGHGGHRRPLPNADVPPVLPSPAPAPSRARPGGTPWRGIAIATIGVFTAVLAAVTVVEAVAGRPLSDLVRGSGGSGTSLFGGANGSGSAPTTPAPTVTTTVTPVVTVVTPTITRTAPATTTTVTPTTTGSTTPTPTPSTSPSTSPTAPTSASGADAGTPSPLG